MSTDIKGAPRVLWLNWRDIKNPASGGAEVLTHEIMRRLVKKGYDMTLFTSRFSDSLEHENIEGINIERAGGKYTVYDKARDYYKKYKNNFDIIVDEINVKPFLTPKFVKEKPVLALIHEVARKALFYELNFPLNYITYYYLVGKWLSYYKNIPIVTVSNSTKKDLEEFRLKNILLIPEGLNISPLSKVPQKESNPTVIFLGRLKRYKLPDHAIEAFSIIKKEIPAIQMWVVGEGKLRKKLERVNIQDISFYGRVNEQLKYELLSRAHLALVPGVHEGWGLVVTEANAMGTPAVAYNVSGLRDSVKDGETGILVKENSPQALAHSAISLLKNQDLLSKFSSNALAFSRQFNWDNSAAIFDKIIRETI